MVDRRVTAPSRLAERRFLSLRPIDGLVAILFLGLGSGLLLRVYITGQAMPGDLGDARFNLAVLEFFYRNLAALLHGRPTGFLNAPFFYPWPKVTNFSDTFWGDGETYALARALGAGELASFRAWFVAGFVLTYAATFLSLRALGLRAWGAAAGAFLFTFPLPMTAQFGHAQLIYRLWVPPAFVAFDRLLTRASLRAGAACVLFAALQFAASVYLGLFLCLLLASHTVAVLLVGRDRLALPSPASVRALRPSARWETWMVFIVGLIILAVVMVPYHAVQSLYGFGRSWPEVATLLPRPGSFLLTNVSRIWPDLSSDFPYPAVWEQQLFPGLSAIIPPIWFLISPSARRRQPQAAALLVTILIFFLLTIDVRGHTIYRLIYPVPGFSAIRAMCRVILVMMLPPSVLLGLMIDDLTKAQELKTAEWQAAGRACAFVLSAFLILECGFVSAITSAPAAWRERAEALAARLPKQLPSGAVLALSTKRRSEDITLWTFGQIDAELAASALGIRTMDGYSGYFPQSWKTPSTCDDVSHDLRAGRHFLVEHGMLGPRIAPEQLVLVGYGMCDAAKLGHDPELVLGRSYRFGTGGSGGEFVGDGFSGPEEWGRWTDAKTAYLFFRLRAVPAGPLAITIAARSFSSAPDRRQVIKLSANGRDCGRFAIREHAPHARVTCPAGVLRPGENMLRLRIARPARPIDLDRKSQDRRHLGLGLEMLTISAER